MGRLDDLEKRLDERLAGLDRQLDERLSRLGVSHGARPGASGPALRTPGFSARMAGMAPEDVFKDYATPSDAEAIQLFEYVRNAPHVRNNSLYSSILGQTRFVFAADDDDLNAYATVAAAENGEAVPMVYLLGGAARFGRMAALAVAATRGGDPTAGGRFLAVLKKNGLAAIDLDWSARTLVEAELARVLEDDRTLTLAKSMSAGLLLGILAHEAGHLSLGHLHQMGGRENNDISRNQEREADSFASSIIASSPFGEYILAGTLFWHFALAQLEDGGRATTHPLSKERFENFVRANPDLAAEFGLGPEA